MSIGRHIGGFAAGFIVCALLDLSARFELSRALRFPEFAKAELLCRARIRRRAAWTIGGEPRDRTALIVAGGVILSFFLLVKSIDLLLSVRRGSAWAAVLLASLDAGLALSAMKIWGGVLPRRLQNRMAGGRTERSASSTRTARIRRWALWHLPRAH